MQLAQGRRHRPQDRSTSCRTTAAASCCRPCSATRSPSAPPASASSSTRSQAGEIRVLAVTSGGSAVEALKDVPTLKESGHRPGVHQLAWHRRASRHQRRRQGRAGSTRSTKMHESAEWKAELAKQRLDRRLRHRRRVRDVPHRAGQAGRGHADRAGAGMTCHARRACTRLAGPRQSAWSPFLLGVVGVVVSPTPCAWTRRTADSATRSAPGRADRGRRAAAGLRRRPGAVDVARGGRGEPEAGEDVDLTSPIDWRTVLLLVGAFVANVAADRPARLGDQRRAAVLGLRRSRWAAGTTSGTC